MTTGSLGSGPVPPGRPPWSRFRAALDAAGFHPSKGKGQNFLLDGNMVRAIAHDARVGEGDFVLEVGPGCGFLSVALASLGVRLLAVEIDRRLHAVAAEFLAPFGDRVELLHADVLAGKHALAAEVRERLPADSKWHLVANLPYSVAGPVLLLLSRLPHPPRTMTALVQLEVAERIAARPGDKGWGILGAKLAPFYRRTLGRPVPAGLFWPRPQVESAVVHLERNAAGDEAVGGSREDFDALVEGLFQQRRKVVRGSLGGLLGDPEGARALLEELGVDPGARPGTLRSEEFAKLAGSPRWRQRTRAARR